MSVKIRVSQVRKEITVHEVTLSEEEYQGFREKIDRVGFTGRHEVLNNIADELLEHPTEKIYDSYSGDYEIESLYDTYEDIDYFD